MKAFKLKREFITSLLETKKVELLMDNGEILKGTSQATIDHPEFTKLRNKLDKLGYIEVQRLWWNGDRVLKPFKLNGMAFKKGDQFPCASALAVRFGVEEGL